MSYNESSSEVAEDFRQSLEELSGNLRVEINNLTIIARENYEHAQAIADAIQDHIKKVAPQKKLPALYVLDSVVKNVGTPYTLYFSRKLMSTFMDAYASVDQPTRRKMDEMLRTWKEPIPGSIDTRPPFPPDVIRPIENALIKARTKAFEGQQENFHAQQQLLGRGRVPVPYRNTPTPPGARPGLWQQGPYGQQPFPGPNGHHGSYPMHPNPQAQPQAQPTANLTPVPSAAGGPFSLPQHQHQHQQPQQAPPVLQGLPYQPPPAAAGYGAHMAQPKVSVEGLLNDLRQVIAAGNAEVAQNPWDTGKQTRLRALVDLQGLLQSANLPEEQLVLINKQVAELAVNIRAPNALALALAQTQAQTQAQTLAQTLAQTQTQTHTPTPPPAPPSSSLVAVASAVAPPAPRASVPSTTGVSIDALFGTGALAALLAGRGSSATPQQSSGPTAAPPPQHQQPQQPQQPQPQPPVRSPLVQVAQPARPPLSSQAGTAVPTDPLSLLSLLRKQGLLSASGQPVAGSTPVPASIPLSLLPPPPPPPPIAAAGGFAQALLSAPGAEIPLKASALKQFRPHLVPLLFDALGKPCTQCGRRFQNDDEGKRRKTAHLDWHFRVHQRIAEAEKRGQHRSWYVDQLDWVHSREVLDVDTSHDATSSTNQNLSFAGGPSGGLSSSALNAGPHTAGANNNSINNNNTTTTAATATTTATSRVPWIPVPDDPHVNTVCPICQEKFEQKWLDEAQEWVWMDAVRVGDRVYHASCHAEATRAGALRGGTPSGPGPGAGGLGSGARPTPERVLGKRKAEDGLLPSSRAKTKTETL